LRDFSIDDNNLTVLIDHLANVYLAKMADDDDDDGSNRSSVSFRGNRIPCDCRLRRLRHAIGNELTADNDDDEDVTRPMIAGIDCLTTSGRSVDLMTLTQDDLGCTDVSLDRQNRPIGDVGFRSISGISRTSLQVEWQVVILSKKCQICAGKI